MKHLSFLFALFSLLIIEGCGGNSNPSRFGPGNGPGQKDPAVSVETIRASQSDISSQIKSFGNIRAKEIVNVTPQVSNRVTKIYAELGDTVQPGEVLAKIYDVPFRDQFEQAKSQLEQNRASYIRDSLQFQRQKELYNRDLISSTEYDNARATFQSSKAQYQSARANLTQSREDLKNTKITSPVYGVVLSRNIAEGDLASTGQTAYQMANLTGLQCRVYLPLDEWRKVKIGQRVDFTVSNESDVTGHGRVTHISPRIDPTTGLGEVIIGVTNRGPSIYQGVLAEATIHVETHKDAVVIPRSALVENVQTLIEPESNSIQLQRTYSAYVVKNDTVALKQDLKLGIEQGDKIEVTQGLKPGDEIVITGQNNLEDSTKVNISAQQQFKNKRDIPIQTEPNGQSGNSPGGSAGSDTSSTSN